MRGHGDSRPTDPTEDRDRLGFDTTRDYLKEALGRFVPQWLVRRAIAVDVSVDRDRIRPGDAVTVIIEFHNRLPVPVLVQTERRRLWGWTVDGELAASDERRYTRSLPGTFAFKPRQRRRFERIWTGRFERTGTPTEWVDATPGEYEIRAFLATDDRRPTAATTITVER
ncbi:hypothetical protein ACFQH6_17155 [Halobacteriaceae archaeon GCM10025711]